ncbi:unnamed protein product [Closterium sp. NIES-64]|nr:unnamed protein product [Closterium sp. NIES-64]
MERTIAQQADTLAALRQQLEEQEQEAARMRAVVAARQPPAPATGGSPGPSSSNSRSTGAGAGLLHATAQRSSPPTTTNAPGPSTAPVVQEGAAIPPVLLDLSFFKQKCNDAVNYFIAGAPAREQSFYPSLAQLRRKVQELYEDVGVPLDMFNRVMAENPERERIMLQKMSERRCNIYAVVKPYAHGPGGYITENKVAMLASENIAPSRRRTPAEWHAHFRDGSALQMVVRCISHGMGVSDEDLECGGFSVSLPTPPPSQSPSYPLPTTPGSALQMVVNASTTGVSDEDLECGGFLLVISCDAQGRVTGL